MEGFWRVKSTLGKVTWIPSARKGCVERPHVENFRAANLLNVLLFLKNRDNVIDSDNAFDVLRGIYDRDGKKVMLSKELGDFFLIRVLRQRR